MEENSTLNTGINFISGDSYRGTTSMQYYMYLGTVDLYQGPTIDSTRSNLVAVEIPVQSIEIGKSLVL